MYICIYNMIGCICKIKYCNRIWQPDRNYEGGARFVASDSLSLSAFVSYEPSKPY